MARPAPESARGPSSGAAITTRAPRRVPSDTAALSAGSPASSPAITMTSSGPTHTGARVAVTKGRLTVSDSAPARIAPAVAAVPRPETHTTARERSSERNGSRAPRRLRFRPRVPVIQPWTPPATIHRGPPPRAPRRRPDRWWRSSGGSLCPINQIRDARDHGGHIFIGASLDIESQ